MMILGWPLTFYGTVKFLSLVAVAELEEWYIAAADMQWLVYSGERIIAHGPLGLENTVISNGSSGPWSLRQRELNI